MVIERVFPDDAEALLAIYAPYVTDTAVSFETEPPTTAEFRRRIETISARYPYIKAVEGGEILGYAYAGAFKSRRAYDWSVETSIYVRADRRRVGVGRALYAALETSLRRMGILNMNACIAAPHTAEGDARLPWDSVRFHERLGFRLVGTFRCSGSKFGAWYDMVWMEKLIGEHTSPPQSVRFGEWTL